MTAVSSPPHPLTHSWPLFEAPRRLPPCALGAPVRSGRHRQREETVGLWSCRLSDDSLCWSPAVHDLFGLPRDEIIPRPLAVSLYLPDSRRAMEGLRRHAIDHQRGFTADCRIRRPNGDVRWMRLTAIPVLCQGRVVRLAGTKQDVTVDYDGPG
ncbi:PAS domain-containing protein [Sphingobium lignivorans]|uniref:PAS domain S-box-containing protein n=1 Tax=Sphingobium lignivorans TaxID=2735886 RepID=A0ABR6N9U7_9SPHN|nr:PAS domain-containing protein [Sphingobium lignivorans]MBB5984046.1 PAS domain S-box-containing protein [Sphingobium lignivorans]